MKYVVAIMAVLFLAACSKETVQLNDQSGRISDLERRMLLNEQLDAVQSQLIQANSDAISAEAISRDEMDQYILSLIDQERQERIDGDQASADALQVSISNQNAINIAVQSQIDELNQSISDNSSSITNLQSQINNINSDLSSIQSAISVLSSSVSSLGLRVTALENAQSDLQDDLSNLSQQVQSQQIVAYRCNASGSTERMLKINGKFYAVMNRVTTEQVQVVTGSASQTITIPKLCKNNGDEIKLPQSNGNCKSNETVVAGTGITTTIAANTVSPRTVVTSVKIALEALSDGSYQTTDGASACNFSISGNGSLSSNLVVAQ